MSSDKPTQTPAAPRTVNGVTPGQRIEMWADLVDSCEAILRAGLRRKLGPDGDVEAAYREWYNRQMADHDKTLRHTLQRINDAEARHARTTGDPNPEASLDHT